MERGAGRVGPSGHDAGCDHGAVANFPELHRADVAGGGAARHFARELREVHRRPRGRREDHGLRRRAARVHQGVLGLCRSARHRRAHRQGREMLAANAAVFDAVERTFGVDRHIIAAIWGVETKYGTVAGERPVIRSTATLACVGRRQAYFKDEFLAALEILQRGDIRPDQLKGSWAGAFGATAVHADGIQALCGRFRRRRAARCRRLRARRGRLDGEPSEEGRMGRGPDLGLRGRAAAGLQLSVRRSGAPADHARMDAARHHAPRRGFIPARERQGYAVRPRGRARAELPDAGELPRHHEIQPGRGLCAGDRASGRPAARRRTDRRRLGRATSACSAAPSGWNCSSILRGTGSTSASRAGGFGLKTRAAVRDFQARSGLVPDGFATVAVLERLRSR